MKMGAPAKHRAFRGGAAGVGTAEEIANLYFASVSLDKCQIPIVKATSADMFTVGANYKF
jgi:hypothetical protein